LSAVVACIRLHHISIPLLGKLREVSTCHTERLREVAIQAVSALTGERVGGTVLSHFQREQTRVAFFTFLHKIIKRKNSK
jgi:hypothetical protein